MRKFVLALALFAALVPAVEAQTPAPSSKPPKVKKNKNKAPKPPKAKKAKKVKPAQHTAA